MESGGRTMDGLDEVWRAAARRARLWLGVAGGIGLLSSPVAAGVALGVPFLIQVIVEGSASIGPSAIIPLLGMAGGAGVGLLYFGVSIACLVVAARLAPERVGGLSAVAWISLTLAVAELVLVAVLLCAGVPDDLRVPSGLFLLSGGVWAVLAGLRVALWWGMLQSASTLRALA